MTILKPAPAVRFERAAPPAAYRPVSRWEHEAALERMAAAGAAAPEKLAARKPLIEQVWGTLKWLRPGGFGVRGKGTVEAEVSLAHFGYNLKRALAVVGLEKLRAALKAWSPKPAGSGVKAVVKSVASIVTDAIQGGQTIVQSWRTHLRRFGQVSSVTV